MDKQEVMDILRTAQIPFTVEGYKFTFPQDRLVLKLGTNRATAREFFKKFTTETFSNEKDLKDRIMSYVEAHGRP